MVLSEQAMRRWKVAGGISTVIVGFSSVFLVDHRRPVTPDDSHIRHRLQNEKHVFSDLQDWFWDRVDSSLGIPKMSGKNRSEHYKSSGRRNQNDDDR